MFDRRGKFWMEESYDHIIRSRAQYDFYREYIRLNPLKAGLSAGMYSWIDGSTGATACGRPATRDAENVDS